MTTNFVFTIAQAYTFSQMDNVKILVIPLTQEEWCIASCCVLRAAHQENIIILMMDHVGLTVIFLFSPSIASLVILFVTWKRSSFGMGLACLIALLLSKRSLLKLFIIVIFIAIVLQNSYIKMEVVNLNAKVQHIISEL